MSEKHNFHPPHIQQLIDQRRKKDCTKYCHCEEVAMYRVNASGFCADHREDAIRAGRKESARWISWAVRRREPFANY